MCYLINVSINTDKKLEKYVPEKNEVVLKRHYGLYNWIIY